MSTLAKAARRSELPVVPYAATDRVLCVLCALRATIAGERGIQTASRKVTAEDAESIVCEDCGEPCLPHRYQTEG